MADIASLVLLAAGAAHEAEVEPSALGLAPGAWVALSMAVLIAIALFLKVPKAITFVTTLPRTGSGKLLRAQLP